MTKQKERKKKKMAEQEAQVVDGGVAVEDVVVGDMVPDVDVVDVEPERVMAGSEQDGIAPFEGEERSVAEDGHLVLGADGYPFKRNMDPMSFRIQRDGEWVTLCFTDMTFDEQRGIIGDRDVSWLSDIALMLAERLRYIADEVDAVTVQNAPEDAQAQEEQPQPQLQA